MTNESRTTSIYRLRQCVSIPEDLRSRYGISTVPIWIQIGDESLKEGSNFLGDFTRGWTGPICRHPPLPSEFVGYTEGPEGQRHHIDHLCPRAAPRSQCLFGCESVPGANVTVYDSGRFRWA